jgi:hypothetical protein
MLTMLDVHALHRQKEPVNGVMTLLYVDPADLMPANLSKTITIGGSSSSRKSCKID